jgi:hypothetical protein
MTRTLTAALVAEIRAIAVRWPGWDALRSRTEMRRGYSAILSAHWLLIAICLSGCAGGASLGSVGETVLGSIAGAAPGSAGEATTGSVAEADQPAKIKAAATSPRLQAGEKIRVTVYGEGSLSSDYQIDPSGFLSLPLAGAVKAAGLTQTELEHELAKRLRSEYLRDPKVTVSVVEFRPFYIIGEIQKPGAYPYSSGLNILRAIAVAGGTTYRGSKSTVEIQRAGESEMREYSLQASIPIMPGDMIRIPQRYF